MGNDNYVEDNEEQDLADSLEELDDLEDDHGDPLELDFEH